MSLKGFHILFVSCSVGLSAGFGFWALRQYTGPSPSVSWLAAMVGALLFGALLIVYGLWFWRKLKHVPLT